METLKDGLNQSSLKPLPGLHTDMFDHITDQRLNAKGGHGIYFELHRRIFVMILRLH